jgi:hypothetical protein
MKLFEKFKLYDTVLYDLVPFPLLRRIMSIANIYIYIFICLVRIFSSSCFAMLT